MSLWRSILPLYLLLLPAAADSQTLPAAQNFLDRLSAAAIARSSLTVRYDPTYVRIPYPNGDVPANTGVCTDEVIRAYRVLGVDLQKDVHEDIKQSFRSYPHPL